MNIRIQIQVQVPCRDHSATRFEHRVVELPENSSDLIVSFAVMGEVLRALEEARRRG